MTTHCYLVYEYSINTLDRTACSVKNSSPWTSTGKVFSDFARFLKTVQQIDLGLDLLTLNWTFKKGHNFIHVVTYIIYKMVLHLLQCDNRIQPIKIVRNILDIQCSFFALLVFVEFLIAPIDHGGPSLEGCVRTSKGFVYI